METVLYFYPCSTGCGRSFAGDAPGDMCGPCAIAQEPTVPLAEHDVCSADCFSFSERVADPTIDWHFSHTTPHYCAQAHTEAQ